MERRASCLIQLGGNARPSIVFFLWKCLLLRLEVERSRVHAIAQSGRAGSIGKDMAEVGIAAGAAYLDARHAITCVGMFGDVLAVGGGEETRPAGSGIKFSFRAEQERAAADAVVGAVVVLVPVLA